MMLKIEKGEPWIMWPNKIANNFIDFPANKIFDYEGNYSFRLEFEIPDEIVGTGTLFAKLPSYFGVNVEENGITLILTYFDNTPQYLYKDFKWKIGKKYMLSINKQNDFLLLLIDDKEIYKIKLIKKLAQDELSHIIFGSGNFPKNEFNLNYISCILYSLEIIKENVMISKHNFNEFIFFKSIDMTDNCNFIHKI